jgi:hypothetical protein
VQRRLPAVGLVVEDDLPDVDGVDAVHERLVDLGDDGEPVALESFDDVDLPERARPVEAPRLDLGDELLELLLGARRRQGEPPHVVAEVEALVVHPDRVRDAAGHEPDALPVARDQGDARLDVAEQPGVVEPGVPRPEDHDGADVHRRRPLLEVEERDVER